MQCVIHGSCTVCAHRATHFGQGILCSRKKLSITLKFSELFFLPPCNCLHNQNYSCTLFWSTTTQTLKAEGRLTRMWIHLIVVKNNLLSGVSRLLVPSHQLPIHQLKGGKKAKGCFSVFFTYSSFPNIGFHILLAAGNIKLSAIMYGVLV